MWSAEFAITLRLIVRPFFGQASIEISIGLLVFCWALFQRLSVMDFSELEETVERAIAVGLQRAGIAQKEAAAIMGTDCAHFQQALRGELNRHIHLDQLLKLPYRFWLHMLPALSALVVKKHVAELAEDAAALLKRRA